MESDMESSFLSLFSAGHNQSSSFEDEDEDPDILFPYDHPLRRNLNEECLTELMRSPLARMERDIIENYDIFLNCIFWQVKGLKGRSATRKAAQNIKGDYLNYRKIRDNGAEKYGPGINSKHMKNLDTISDHDDLYWNEMEGFSSKKSRSNMKMSNKDDSKRVMPVPKPSSRIRRRNASGPFFPRPQLEKMFEYTDVEEHYRKGTLLAKGAFGKVYLGEVVQDLNCKVAIKSTKLKHEPSRIHNIAIEIYLLEQAAHPNVVKHIKSFYWDKQIWSVMEYCPGGALTSLRKVKLSELELHSIMKQILTALEHMHKHNIAHRDLKCANILLDIHVDLTTGDSPVVLTSADIKIGDFGLAAQVEGVKSQTAMCGSRYWMSPEMIQRVGYDTRTDLYSCGCVMFELMTGKAPYRNQGGLLALFLHATKGCEELPPEIQSMYSPDCIQFFRSLVTFNQDHRPSINNLAKDKWLLKHNTDGTTLKAALNSAYEIEGHANEQTLREKFKKKQNRS